MHDGDRKFESVRWLWWRLRPRHAVSGGGRDRRSIARLPDIRDEVPMEPEILPVPDESRLKRPVAPPWEASPGRPVFVHRAGGRWFIRHDDDSDVADMGMGAGVRPVRGDEGPAGAPQGVPESSGQ